LRVVRVAAAEIEGLFSLDAALFPSAVVSGRLFQELEL